MAPSHPLSVITHLATAGVLMWIQANPFLAQQQNQALLIVGSIVSGIFVCKYVYSWFLWSFDIIALLKVRIVGQLFLEVP